MTIWESDDGTGLATVSDRWLAGPLLKGRPERAYGEQAFRYFLLLERARAERSGRGLLLLLVDLKTDIDAGTDMPPAISDRLITGVTLCVRDVDVIGWYHSGRVVGAVLTQGADNPALEAADEIRRRVAAVLTDLLPVDLGDRLRVRVLQRLQSEWS